MSKRYGRNQRRKARQAIENLATEVRITRGQMVRAEQRGTKLEHQMRDWARRIVARLGDASAFALEKKITAWQGGVDAMLMPVPGLMMPVHARMEVYADRIPQDLITMFVHHVESTYDKSGGRELKGQLVLHLYRGKDHEPLYIALSAQQMDEIRYSKDDQYMSFLIKGLARQFARHAEEMRNG